MDINSWLNQAKALSESALARTTHALGSGAGFVSSTLGSISVFGSTESSGSYDSDRVDEKHYLLIPDRRSEEGYSLYVIRCLPDGVPPINDLPKHRVFHLPNQHALPTVEHILLANAKETAETAAPSERSAGARLHDLADQIDRLDGRVFRGALLIGGLVALVNPVVGAAVAAKALLPSVGLLLSMYGLKYASDTADEMQLAGRIKAAEKDVLQQFRGSNVESIVNPILSQLDRALDTHEEQYDPVMEFDSETLTFGQRDCDRLLKLTCRAVVNTYEDVIDGPAGSGSADLGPEDLRYLKMLRDIAKEDE